MGAHLSRPPPGGEIVLAFPDAVVPLKHVRSTILIQSVANVRAAGRFDDYRRHLPEQHHAILFQSIAGEWIAYDAARAHYVACERLGLTAREQHMMGRTSVEKVGESFVGTAVRLAKQAGATPWTLFPQLQRFWSRGYDGGGIAVYKLGPKDARIDLVSFGLCDVPFYRRALLGWIEGLTQLFCHSLYMHEKGQPTGPDSVTFRAQWV